MITSCFDNSKQNIAIGSFDNKMDIKGKRNFRVYIYYTYIYVIKIDLLKLFSYDTAFGAGGYYGLNLGWEGKLIAQTAGATVVPYGGLTCWGEVGVGFILYGKLRLEGDIMDLRFPTYAEIGFSKFPLDVT